MTRRGKVVLAVLAAGSALSLTAATNAWFVSVSHTPPGMLSSALVRYLPERGESSFSSLLTYGNLVSGSSVDFDGVALILPGERLLASATVDDRGVRTVRTSIARPFEEGETADTVIHWELRSYTRPDGASVELTRKQRDLMDARDAVDRWWMDDLLLETAPSPNPTLYDIVTTTGENTVENGAQGTTTTTTVVTTTYTPRAAADHIPAYRHETTTAKIVTHEPAVITPREDAGLWDYSGVPASYIRATETVLFTRDGAPSAQAEMPTRSSLVIEQTGVDAAPTADAEPAPIPLTLENHSTVTTNVRVGLNVRLTSADGKTSNALTLRGPDPDGSCYLGGMYENKFVELLVFRPYSGAPDYNWTPVAEEMPGTGAWALWDLTVDGSTDLPAIESEPAPYIVSEFLDVASTRSAWSGATSEVEFERLFNRLYCDNLPIITVHLSYYVRQSEYMDWTEFYSRDIDMSLYKGSERVKSES